MKSWLFLIPALLSIAACAHLPRVDQDAASSSWPTASECRDLFPQGRWQMYHSIEATVPGGQKQTLTGVAVISSRNRSIQWALMTVEGFVLFSGDYNGTLTVDRAVSPFDRPGFAQGLLDDLMLLFFAPLGSPIITGRLEEGAQVCRYSSAEKTTDLVIKDDRTWGVRQYSSRQRLVRSVMADGITTIGNSPFASHLILKNHGMIGYQLELRLIEAVSLD